VVKLLATVTSSSTIARGRPVPKVAVTRLELQVFDPTGTTLIDDQTVSAPYLPPGRAIFTSQGAT
jgi:hypothetical protein